MALFSSFRAEKVLYPDKFAFFALTEKKIAHFHLKDQNLNKLITQM